MKIQKQIVAVNTFGAVGYMLLVTVWAFFVSILLVLALEPATMNGIIESVPASDASSKPASGAVVVAGYVITAIMIAVLVGVVLTLPYFLGKWGSRFLRAVLRIFRIKITAKTLFLTKGLLMVLPLLGLTILQLLFRYEDLTFGAIFGVSVAAATLGLTAYICQLLLVRRFGVTDKRVW